MKAFLSIKYHEDYSNRERIERLCATLERYGCETVCVARDLEAWGQVTLAAGDLMRRTFALLESCDLVVVELTEKGVGVGIEAGYARARGIPIIALARTGCDISATLQGIARQVLWYEDEAADLLQAVLVPQ